MASRFNQPEKHMKKCSKCGRSDVEFHRDAQRKDGLSSRCRGCKAASDAAKYAKDPERAKAYRKEHQPEATTRAFQRYWADPAKAREAAAKRRAAHPRTDEQRTRDAAVSKQWYANNRERALANKAAYADRARDLRFQREFGITLADYRRMLTAQGGVCAICKEPPVKRWLSVDHCHNTAAVRGLLCQPCNIAIGWLKHSTALLDAAKDYLRPAAAYAHEDLMMLM